MNDHELLRQYLADRNVPCAGCGFNLRGLSQPTCPECGMALRLDVPRQTILDRRRGLVWTVAILMAILDLVSVVMHVYYIVTYPAMGGVYTWTYAVGGFTAACMLLAIIIVMIRLARRPSDELALGLIWLMLAASLTSMLSWLLQAVLGWL